MANPTSFVLRSMATNWSPINHTYDQSDNNIEPNP